MRCWTCCRCPCLLVRGRHGACTCVWCLQMRVCGRGTHTHTHTHTHSQVLDSDLLQASGAVSTTGALAVTAVASNASAAPGAAVVRAPDATTSHTHGLGGAARDDAMLSAGQAEASVASPPRHNARGRRVAAEEVERTGVSVAASPGRGDVRGEWQPRSVSAALDAVPGADHHSMQDHQGAQEGRRGRRKCASAACMFEAHHLPRLWNGFGRYRSHECLFGYTRVLSLPFWRTVCEGNGGRCVQGRPPGLQQRRVAHPRHARMHARMYTYMHACVHADSMYVHIHAYVHAYARAATAAPHTRDTQAAHTLTQPPAPPRAGTAATNA